MRLVVTDDSALCAGEVARSLRPTMGHAAAPPFLAAPWRPRRSLAWAYERQKIRGTVSGRSRSARPTSRVSSPTRPCRGTE